MDRHNELQRILFSKTRTKISIDAKKERRRASYQKIETSSSPLPLSFLLFFSSLFPSFFISSFLPALLPHFLLPFLPSFLFTSLPLMLGKEKFQICQCHHRNNENVKNALSLLIIFKMFLLLNYLRRIINCLKVGISS